MVIQRIAIIGLGLIGGSLAKAFKLKKQKIHILGVDPNPANIEPALKEGSIDEACQRAADAAAQADVIFLCSPVGTIPGLMAEIKDSVPEHAVVTDVGSTKQEIMEAAKIHFGEGGRFIGGHPMAGTENSGYQASIPHLFENAYYLLVPLPSTPKNLLEAFASLIESIGALPIVMDAEVHDKIVGSVSHLPHVVAAALVNSVRQLNDPDHYKEKLAAGGFRDITRIASSNPRMWTEISLANRHQLQSLISSMIQNLDQFLNWLREGKAEEIQSFFSEAREFRQSLPTLQSLALLPYYDLYVDIEDRPGEIGEVTTILGRYQINIKNLRIINSREGEPGCLVLSLSDNPSLEKAWRVLSDHGYKTYKK
mgnify:CR=1 FL=1